MNTKEELSKLLFDATTAISAVMANIEFGKDVKAMSKTNRFRNWLVDIQNKLNNESQN